MRIAASSCSSAVAPRFANVMLVAIAVASVAVIGRSFAFALKHDNTAFFSTPGKPPVLKSHIVELLADGTTSHRSDLAYGQIVSIDFDKNDRLCLATEQGFRRLEPNNMITNIRSYLPLQRLAVSADGYWYAIQFNMNDSFSVRKFDEFGNDFLLPIAINKNSFGADVYKVLNASIDIDHSGNIVIIATALGSQGQGPFLQRVYRANSDGSNLWEIANLDSKRIGGMVDIAASSDGNIFVLTAQGSTGDSDVIYRIDQYNKATKFIEVCAGNDPKSIDVDHTSGDLWFCTTQGIFRVSRN